MTIDADSFFAALAHPLRLRALVLLHGTGELCVCELTHALDVSQPVISRHLAQLREAGVAEDRRRGRWIYYRVHPRLPAWARAVLAESAGGLARARPYSADRAALERMPDRPGTVCCP